MRRLPQNSIRRKPCIFRRVAEIQIKVALPDCLHLLWRNRKKLHAVWGFSAPNLFAIGDAPVSAGLFPLKAEGLPAIENQRRVHLFACQNRAVVFPNNLYHLKISQIKNAIFACAKMAFSVFFTARRR